MAIEQELPSSEEPNNISIEVVQSEKKAAHVCIFDGCTRGKRGYSEYCREHKAIGKIIAGKVAREKAARVDPSMSMYEEALRIQESPSNQVFVQETMKIIILIAALFLAVYILVIIPIQGFFEIISGLAWG
tara:strand:- start:65 stop:457 length:393 start_codon:yes stop_codon:yes gene_type:complete